MSPDIHIKFCLCCHYDDVIMGTIASQITSLPSVYSTVYSGTDQSKHQSSASLAFVWGIHRGPVNSPHKWPIVRGKCFHLMTSSCVVISSFTVLTGLVLSSYLFYRGDCVSARELILRYQATQALQWRHTGYDGVSNQQRYDCLLNHLFKRRSKKASKLCVAGLCEGNSPVTGEFPTQKGQ